MSIEYPIYEQFNNAGTLQKPVVGPALASGAAIAPTHAVHHVTGVAAITNITLPWTDFSGVIALIADGLFSWTAAGNINSAGAVQSTGSVLLCTYDPAVAKWFISAPNVPGVTATGAQVPQTIRVRATTAEANAGKTLLPAIPGYKYRLTDFTMIAIGGNAATATSVRITATQAAAPAHLYIVLIAALTRSTNVKGNSANVTALADGACLIANDVNTAITLTVDNNNLATATHIDTILTFVLDT